METTFSKEVQERLRETIGWETGLVSKTLGKKKEKKKSKKEARRWWKAKQGNVASLNALRNNAWPRRKEEREIPGKMCAFHLAAMHTNALATPYSFARRRWLLWPTSVSGNKRHTTHARDSHRVLFEHEEDHWLATSLFQRRTPFGVSLSLLPVGKKLERTRSQIFAIFLFLSLSLVNI